MQTVNCHTAGTTCWFPARKRSQVVTDCLGWFHCHYFRGCIPNDRSRRLIVGVPLDSSVRLGECNIVTLFHVMAVKVAGKLKSVGVGSVAKKWRPLVRPTKLEASLANPVTVVPLSDIQPVADRSFESGFAAGFAAGHAAVLASARASAYPGIVLMWH